MAWVPVAMMAAGAIAGQQKQKRQQAMEESDRKLAAETARYSPWTGMTPNQIRHAENSAFGATLGGGLAGYAQGASMSKGSAPTDEAAGGSAWGASSKPNYLSNGQYQFQDNSNQYRKPGF